MNTDKYLSRRYNIQTYNCAHFAADVWYDLFGYDLSLQLTGFMRKKAEREVRISSLRAFKKLDCPKSPCFVWLHSRDISHVGVYIDGKVLHIRESGVKLELLDTLTIGYKKVTFYDVEHADHLP